MLQFLGERGRIIDASYGVRAVRCAQSLAQSRVTWLQWKSRCLLFMEKLPWKPLTHVQRPAAFFVEVTHDYTRPF